MSYPQSAIAHTATPATTASRAIPALAAAHALTTSPIDWQARAVSSYGQAQRKALEALPELLATRVSALTGRSINPEDVFVDRDAALATVVVDGVVFRAHDHKVVILRTCEQCGIQRFESAPLFSRADLGYALRGWQPRCHGCEEEDSVNWLES